MANFLGTNITNARIKKRLKQKEIAEMVNVDPSTWSLYESDNREPPITTLRLICEKLDVSADYLLGFTKEMKLKKDD